jgi:hypothetical protein
MSDFDRRGIRMEKVGFVVKAVVCICNSANSRPAMVSIRLLR